MTRTLLLVLVSAALAACEEAPPTPDGEVPEPEETLTPDQPQPIDDPDVERIHERMMETMAPDEGWERARYLTFDLVAQLDDGTLRRSHEWDRTQDRARVVQPADDDRQLTADFPIDDHRAGEAWLDDEPQEGDEAQELLDGAHRSFINDSYWFVMPYKWTDPGVNLEYLGEETDDDGRDWEVVQLSFDDVGLTPQNMYRAWIDAESGLMERWQFISEEGAEPSPSEWTDWQFFGPIQLATRRIQDGNPRITFENIRVEEEVPAEAFQDPP